MRFFITVLLGSLSFIVCTSPAPTEFTAWAHPVLLSMDRSEIPPEIPVARLEVRAAKGEYESAALAVRAVKNLELSIEYKPGNMPANWVKLNLVKSLADTTRPNRLYPLDGPAALDSARTEFVWLTVHPPDDAETGAYKGTMVVSANSQRQNIDVECEVLPFQLEENTITAGAFLCLADLPDGWHEDMKRHGIDAVQFFTWEWSVRDTSMLARRGEWVEEPIAISSRGDEIVLDFKAMDRMMDRINDAGMRGPVVISLGNDRLMHYEIRIADVMGMPIDTTSKPTPKGWSSRTITFIGPPMSERLDSLFISGIHQLQEHWAEKQWSQELVILIYDEPTHGLLERGKQRYDLIKRYYPDTRIYGVVMDKRELARDVAPQCDVIVCNGDFDGCREVALELGKDLFTYGGMGSENRTRFLMGCLPWRARSQGSFFWMYNYWFYSPDRCAVYQHPDNWQAVVRSVQWENIREGCDDLRYFATAEKMIESFIGDRRDKFSARLEQIRDTIDIGYRGNRADRDEMGREKYIEHLEYPQQVREQVIALIMEMLEHS